MDVLPVVKNVSIYSIGYDYISLVFGNTLDDKEQARILQIINSILDLGYCADTIYRTLNNLVANKDYKTLFDIDMLFNYFRNNKQSLLCKDDYNLLNSSTVRSHKRFQLTCSAPVINMEPSIFNKFEVIEQEYFLEPIASYSFSDLLEYVYSKKKYILMENNNDNKIRGALQYMLNTWGDVNIILFALDKAIEECAIKDRKLKDLFDIGNHLEDAIKLNQKIIDRITYGDITFVPKKRLLFEGSGLLDKQREEVI